MSDKLVVVLTIASCVIPLTIVPAVVCTIMHIRNLKRKHRCTSRVLAAVSKIEGCTTQHENAPGQSKRFTLEYAMGNYDYVTHLTGYYPYLKVGSQVPIFIDPLLPENVYIEGEVERQEDSIKLLCTASAFLALTLIIASLFFTIN